MNSHRAMFAALRSCSPGPAQDGFVRLTPCPPARAEARTSSFTSGGGQTRPAPAVCCAGNRYLHERRGAALRRSGGPGQGTLCLCRGRVHRAAGPERVCPAPEVKEEARPSGRAGGHGVSRTNPLRAGPEAHPRPQRPCRGNPDAQCRSGSTPVRGRRDHSCAVGCESSDDGQSRMYALSIRFSKFWLSTTALATSYRLITPMSMRLSITGM